MKEELKAKGNATQLTTIRELGVMGIYIHVVHAQTR